MSSGAAEVEGISLSTVGREGASTGDGVLGEGVVPECRPLGSSMEARKGRGELGIIAGIPGGLMGMKL